MSIVLDFLRIFNDIYFLLQNTITPEGACCPICANDKCYSNGKLYEVSVSLITSTTRNTYQY